MKKMKTRNARNSIGFPPFNLRWNKVNFLMVMLAIALSVGSTGCKKKKMADAQQIEAEERAERIARAREILMAILNDEGNMTLAEKERELQRIIDMNIDDPEIQDLIAQVEAKLAREREMAAKEEAAGGQASYSQVSNYFSSIANASSMTSANRSINEALGMFASPDTPVLIIIHQEGDQKDYDRPTTIQKFLNYLKDQKRFDEQIENLVFNDQGKITEVELKR